MSRWAPRVVLIFKHGMIEEELMDIEKAFDG